MRAREHQTKALAALYRHIETRGGNPVVVAPTGAGKSYMIAETARWITNRAPGARVLVLQHVQELITQNFGAFRRVWPEADCGIYSASVGMRQNARQIVFAGIQSAHRRPTIFGRNGFVDAVIIDEAHLIPKKSGTMYNDFLQTLQKINPALLVIGYTATPYRTDSGQLIEGDDRIFDAIAHEIELSELVEAGWLSPLVSKATSTVLDVQGVRVRGGDFIVSELGRQVNLPEVTRSVCAEIARRGADRFGWLVFGVTVDHAEAIAHELRTAHGVAVEVITGETPRDRRRKIIERYKAREIRALVSVAVLTTGFDAPHTDLLALVRPTKSVGLYVQMMGRGMRPVYEDGFEPNSATAEQRVAAIMSGSKPNCLVLDFGENVARHGPVDRVIQPHQRDNFSDEDAAAPVKICPGLAGTCDSQLHISVRVCPDCGHEFPEPERRGTEVAADVAPMAATPEGPAWEEVRDVAFRLHEKEDKPPSMRVYYLVGRENVSEWVCFEHPGMASRIAARWWRSCANDDVPRTTAEALRRQGEIRRISHIRRVRGGKFWQIVDRMTSPPLSFDARPNASQAAE